MKSKAALTTMSNFKGGFGSEQLSKDPVMDAPNFTNKNKEPPVNKTKQKLANELFQQVLNPAPKFKGPQPKSKVITHF